MANPSGSATNMLYINGVAAADADTLPISRQGSRTAAALPINSEAPMLRINFPGVGNMQSISASAQTVLHSHRPIVASNTIATGKTGKLTADKAMQLLGEVTGSMTFDGGEVILFG